MPVKTEIGQLHGASFRIDVPQNNWNHNLVMYYHGYESKPRVFAEVEGQPRPPSRILQQILNRGYAVAESGYSAGGWAVEYAFKETEELREYFNKRYGKPKETLVMGHSMGGLLTVMTLEQRPENYAGGLALCGVLAPTDLVMQRAFANRVAFDAFFPGVLPEVDHIPSTFMMNDVPVITNVQKALDAKPDSAALIRSLADIHTNRGLADVLVFNTFVIEDLRLKTGGNPFDNRNLIYTGTTDDYTLNTQVKRYAADPRAVRYMSSFYTPMGALKRKLLAVHTTYDPLVPAATAAYYDEATRRSGVGDLFVQKYVNRDGHCNITADQTGEVFDELTRWIDKSQRPQPGLLAETPAEAAEPHPPTPLKSPPEPQPKSPPKNVGRPQ
ncbi:putative membrane protein [Acidisarcina polymorpha]|uniref:Putative membrane protein n=1 Tax=Acidisarcina polymorpha TaxID=2211140 RepID=A0A2Z5FUS9_9BACT|nr:putative membrane protein [Acidisarcina polymorpha]